MNAPTRRIKPAYKLDKSTAHFQRAVKSMPLGVSSNFRFWGEGKTVYVKRGRGARLWDFDDNCYIDYRLGYGPAILGHCHPEVDAAAREGQEVGTVFALGTEREVVVAEMISEMVPAAELVRFSNSGTEAVMAALRLARGATGRDHYVTFEGSYHGLFDATMWTADMANMTDAVKGPDVVSYGKGIPQLVRQLFWQVPLQRCQPPRGCVEATRPHDRSGADRADPRQLLRHSLQARVHQGGARALHQI
jgi:glutamate-1-semialdehyde 2,1-aminomutase